MTTMMMRGLRTLMGLYGDTVLVSLTILAALFLAMAVFAPL